MAYVFDAPLQHRAPATAWRPTRAVLLRAVLLAGVVLAMGAAWLGASAAAAPVREAELERVLLLMAALKGAITLGAIAMLVWRFGHALPAAGAVAYLVGAWLLAAGSLSIGLLVQVGPGAGAFHAGVLMLIVAAWRDRCA